MQLRICACNASRRTVHRKEPGSAHSGAEQRAQPSHVLVSASPSLPVTIPLTPVILGRTQTRSAGRSATDHDNRCWHSDAGPPPVTGTQIAQPAAALCQLGSAPCWLRSGSTVKNPAHSAPQRHQLFWVKGLGPTIGLRTYNPTAPRLRWHDHDTGCLWQVLPLLPHALASAGNSGAQAFIPART